MRDRTKRTWRGGPRIGIASETERDRKQPKAVGCKCRATMIERGLHLSRSWAEVEPGVFLFWAGIWSAKHHVRKNQKVCKGCIRGCAHPILITWTGWFVAFLSGRMRLHQQWIHVSIVWLIQRLSAKPHGREIRALTSRGAVVNYWIWVAPRHVRVT